MKKITLKPSTIDDLPIIVKEAKVHLNFYQPVSVVKKLEEASKKTGHSKNEIVERALRAFLFKEK